MTYRRNADHEIDSCQLAKDRRVEIEAEGYASLYLNEPCPYDRPFERQWWSEGRRKADAEMTAAMDWVGSVDKQLFADSCPFRHLRYRDILRMQGYSLPLPIWRHVDSWLHSEEVGHG